VRTIASAQGRWYVRLLAHDIEQYAMLQEALGASIADLHMSPERKIEALCETLRQAWRAAGADPATIGRWTAEWVEARGWLAKEPLAA